MTADHRLSSSFGTAAGAYAAHRPDYARAAVEWALAPAPGRRVLDLGAGTGKLTGTVLSLADDVIAVEPDAAMLAELRRSLPEVRALPGRAEEIPLPDGCVDVVLSGNAMHWFDMDVAGSEIARILAPGGVLAGLWNLMDDRVGWVAELARVSGPAAIGARDTPARWRTETRELHQPRHGSKAWFGAAEQDVFPHGQPRTAESLIETLATKAGILVMPEDERAELLGRVRAFLAGRTETAHGEFVMPMLTGVLRTRRL